MGDLRGSLFLLRIPRELKGWGLEVPLMTTRPNGYVQVS